MTERKPNNEHLDKIKGVIVREIAVKRPTGGMVEIIINAQAQKPNRLVQVQWKDQEGKMCNVTIDPRRYSNIPERRGLSYAAGDRVDLLTVQEILPL